MSSLHLVHIYACVMAVCDLTLSDFLFAPNRASAAEIVLVHIDAVLDTPNYTIRLPDGARKQTNWDKLIPLYEWEK